MIVDEPSIAPAVVPMASLIIASFTFGILPSCLTIPVFSASPTKVPMVSKIFTMSRDSTTKQVLSDKKPVKSNLQKIGLTEWGIDTGNQPFGRTVTPIGIPINVAITIP